MTHGAYGRDFIAVFSQRDIGVCQGGRSAIGVLVAPLVWGEAYGKVRKLVQLVLFVTQAVAMTAAELRGSGSDSGGHRSAHIRG